MSVNSLFIINSLAYMNLIGIVEFKNLRICKKLASSVFGFIAILSKIISDYSMYYFNTELITTTFGYYFEFLIH